MSEVPWHSSPVLTGDGPGGIYGPDDAYQAVEAGWVADVEQAGFFPASNKEHKLQIQQTHIQYTIPFHVNHMYYFLSVCHQLLVPLSI